MALDLTNNELDGIVGHLTASGGYALKEYDQSKYPPGAYQLMVDAFRRPELVSDGDIERALKWKYGHWRKINYPSAQRRLAEQIARKWKSFSTRKQGDAAEVFVHWMKALERKASAPYITVTFLLHLLHPGQFPIIDQHTFRAMNWLITTVRPGWQGRRAPRRYDDLKDYTEFFDALFAACQGRDATLSRSELDQGLMVLGQGLKQGKRQRTRRVAGLATAPAAPQRLERARKPAKCPACGHATVAEILYGLPASSPQLDMDISTGRLVFGGCCVSDDDPSWKCIECGVAIYPKHAR